MTYSTMKEIKDGISSCMRVGASGITVTNGEILKENVIDELIYTAVFSEDEALRASARWIIRKTGEALGIYMSSIQDLYDAMGREEVSGFTVPAINIRGITYHTASSVFRAAIKESVGPFIFEIARSEMGYTHQKPAEYSAALLAAAIKTGYKGPVFIQGDHFQINAKKHAKDPEGEKNAIKDLIRDAVEAGFYNIDIDASTVVDLSRPTIREQQEANYSITAEMTSFIRDIEPEGITVSIGGEIGEVGTKNTTVEEFEAFMENYVKILEEKGGNIKGISKISIQTGTSHGGVPLPDGSIAQVNIDFDALRNISDVARRKYRLSGAVQHGASTLPDEAFDRFPATGTSEVHLATGFQNILYDGGHFPEDLKEKMYGYIRRELAGDKKDTDTEEQFIYKTRKKVFGPFKEDMWNIPSDVLSAICGDLERQFAFLFKKLKVDSTLAITEKYIKRTDVPVPMPRALA